MELKNKTCCNIAVSWCLMVSDYSNDRRMPTWKNHQIFHLPCSHHKGNRMCFFSHLLPFTWSDSDILYVMVSCFSKFWDVHPFNWEDVCWSILYSDPIESTGILKRCKEPQKTWRRRRKGSSSTHQCLSCVDSSNLLARTCIQICFSMFECIYMNDSVQTPLFSNDNRGLQRGLGIYVRTLNCTDIYWCMRYVFLT